MEILRKEFWEKNQSILLSNPSYSLEEQHRFQILLEKGSDWPNHVWLSTSGSFSPKWVGLSKQALLASAAAVNDHLESHQNDRWIHALPDFHVGGLGIWARAYLSGGKVYDFKKESREKWQAEAFYNYIKDFKGTLIALVPAQLHDLIRLEKQAPESVRAVIIGGSELLPALYEQGRVRGWPLLPSYGLTECGSQVATASLESLQEDTFPSLQLLSHLQACEQEGMLSFFGPSLLSTYAYLDEKEVYYRDPKIEGWLRTEDRGKVEGRELKLLGRKDDIVKIGGESVNLADLDRYLQKLCDQLKLRVEATLVALPHERLGCVIHLATTSQGEELNLLVKEFQESVLPFERIRHIHFLSHFPYSALGKVRKKELYDHLSSGSLTF